MRAAEVTRDALLLGVAEVAREHLSFEGDLAEEAPLVEVFRLDSVRMLTLIAELENRFLVCLEEGDEVGLVTVADLITLLQRRLP